MAFSDIMKFCGRFALLYMLLVAPWPGVQQAYGTLFRLGGDLVFHSFGPDGSVRFEPRQGNSGPLDTEIVLTQPFSRRAGHMQVESRAFGYLPIVFFVALVIATAGSWSRRVRALAWGMALVHAFIALRVAIPLMLLGSDGNPHLFTIGAFWRTILLGAENAIAVHSASSFVVPMLIWMVVSPCSGLSPPLMRGECVHMARARIRA